MRTLLVVLALVTVSCSGGEAETTAAPTTTATTAPATTTTTPPPTTTSSPATTTSSTTTTSTTLPAGFIPFTHPMFTLTRPDAWMENPEFPVTGVGFLQDHSALAVPATNFSVFLEEQEDGFDLDSHIQQVQDDLAFFVADFRVLDSGEEIIDGARSIWFEYADDLDGFAVVIREQAALRENLLLTFTLISPVEFFEYDARQADLVTESFRFS
jgi:hypothetical protein